MGKKKVSGGPLKEGIQKSLHRSTASLVHRAPHESSHLKKVFTFLGKLAFLVKVVWLINVAHTLFL